MKKTAPLVTLECAHCHAAFQVEAHSVQGAKRQRYCSANCARKDGMFKKFDALIKDWQKKQSKIRPATPANRRGRQAGNTGFDGKS